MSGADDHVADDLPELALGLLDGEGLARAMAHVERCERCRQDLDGLVRAVDALLAAGPVAEPPPGFESAVLARMAAGPLRRTRPARVLAAAAAALLVAVLVGGLAGRAVTRGDGPATAVLVTAAGERVGRAWVLPGAPASLAVEMGYRTAWPGDGGSLPVTVELVDDRGDVAQRAGVRLVAGRLDTVVRLRVAAGRLRSLRLLGPGGRVLCHGTIN